MKKNIFIIIAFLSALATTPTPSFALSTPVFCPSCAPDECESMLDFSNSNTCAETTHVCLNKNCARGCSSCVSGYKLEAHTFQPDGCSNSRTVYSCVKESSGGGTDPEPECDGTCDGCSVRPHLSYENLTADPGYAMANPQVCNTETCMCEPTWHFSCADGYYGTASCNSFTDLEGNRNCTGCTKCPTLDGVDAFTQLFSFVAPGGSSITDCFIKANIELNDSTGTYVFESKCNYKQ